MVHIDIDKHTIAKEITKIDKGRLFVELPKEFIERNGLRKGDPLYIRSIKEGML